ncbi:MAG: DUF2341 domain-containing protein [Candidatus Thorarchaeota archaeon]
MTRKPMSQIIIAVLLISFFITTAGIQNANIENNQNIDVVNEQTRAPAASSSTGTNQWIHDCSNMTAFDGIGNDTWTHTSTLGVSFGALSSAGGYIYASDYGTGTDHFGPLYYHTLSSSFPIDDLNSLKVEVEIDGSNIDRMGKVIVGLHDETGSRIAHVEVGDGWSGLDYAASNALYQFSNGSFIYTPRTYPDYMNQEPHRGTVMIYQNTTGIFTEIPTGFNEKLIDASDIEPERNVKYISVYIARHKNNLVTETLRLHRIELNWGQISWNDDCADTNVFTGIGDDTWPHNSDVSVTFGSVSSSGTYYYCDDVGVGAGHHGPLLYHTLEIPMTLDQFSELRADIEIDASSNSQRGWIRIGLHDSDNSTIMTMQVADPWTGTSAAYAQGIYRYTNGTTTETRQTIPDYTNPEPSRENFRIISNSTGLYTSMPGITNESILGASEIEYSRTIRYISIQFNGYETGELCDTMRIHDIELISRPPLPLTFNLPGLSSFPYRMFHAISGSPGAGTNYQVEIRVHSGTGVDSGNLVNIPSAYWTPSNPVRFTDNDGETLLDYWKEWSDVDDAIYWVEVKDNLDFDTGIFLYFGNSSETSLSNGEDTFLFFDDFENGNLNRWDYVGSQWGVTTGDKRYGSYSAHYDGLSHSDFIISNLTSSQSSIMIHSWYKPEATFRGGKLVFYTSINDRKEAVTSHDSYWQYWDGSVYTKYDVGAVVNSPPMWDRLELGVDLANYQMMLWVNRTFIGSATHIYDDDGNNITQSETVYKIEVSNQVNYEHWADDYYVRKWIQAEPIHDLWQKDVEDLQPSISSPSDIYYDESDAGHVISWNPTSYIPKDYAIFLEETPVKSGVWNSSSEIITIPVDGHDLGSFNYTVLVSNILNGSAVDTVFVHVADGTNPIVDSPGDVFFNEGDTGYTIVWDPSDLHPVSYEIFRDAVSVKTGLWNLSSESIFIGLDGFPFGTYDFMIVVTDVGSNTDSDNVLVVVSDGINPTTTHPSNVTMAEGTPGINIQWQGFDINPLSYIIYENEVMVKSGLWNVSGDTFTISLDGFNLGLFNFTLQVTDADSNMEVDTVFVDVYDGTSPIVDAPADVYYNEGQTGYSIIWGPSDLHPVSYEIFRDAVSIKSGVWNSSAETISISVGGFPYGTYSYQIVVTDIGDHTDSDTVLVVVSDVILPTTTHPSNVTIAEGSSGINLQWQGFDINPSSYEIIRNEVVVKSGLWNVSGDSFTISLDGLNLGIFNFTLQVFDVEGNSAADTVFVEVYDETSPILDSPADIYFDEGDPGYSIIWDPSDLHPTSYEIFRDAVFVRTGAWNSSSETISISLDGLPYGAYSFMILVTDIGDNTDSDTVLVFVSDGTTPTTTHPSNVTIAEGSSGLSIQWQGYDLNPLSYIIFQNDVAVKSGLWNASGDSFAVSLNGLGLGITNFTLQVTDADSNTAVDTVFIEVYDGTFPILDSPADINVNEGETGNAIEWNVTDLHPVSYEIFRDAILVKSGMWNSSAETISIDLEGLPIGTYIYVITVTDIGDNTDTDQVLVVVSDGTLPILGSLDDVDYDEGVLDLNLEWTPTDLHPDTYEIYRDGILVSSGLWNSSSEIISIQVGELSYGVYNFSLIVFDVGGNNASDLVTVTVSDGTPPTINSPLDIEYTEGETGNLIVWTPLDLHPDIYELHRNGTLITSGPWDGSVIQFSVDSLLVGNYRFTITVWDVDGNMVSDEVIVIVSPEGSTSTTTMDSGYVTMVIVIGAGSTIIILIVVIFIGSKKRKH